MSAPLLLDTCAAIWVANDEPIGRAAADSMQRAIQDGELMYVSPITAWEIGILVSRNRMSLLMSPKLWFDRLLQAPGLGLADMSSDVLIASSFLPGRPPRDSADRILAATAREHGYMLMTRDRPLLDYAAQGHMQALAC